MKQKISRKTIIAVIALFSFFILANLASAQRFSGIYVSNEVSRGDDIEVFANAKNTLDKKINHAKMVVYIPELDIYESSDSFFMSRSVNYGRNMQVYVPADAEPQEYDVRISLFHNGKMQHKWRVVTVE